ncbi:MAG: hypothetical protein GWO10_07140, partial [candidate division Zixibacteria bacterium]|nr:hypothetical protein [candidate division Zixibacteria bacterium]
RSRRKINISGGITPRPSTARQLDCTNDACSARRTTRDLVSDFEFNGTTGVKWDAIWCDVDIRWSCAEVDITTNADIAGLRDRERRNAAGYS